ncbi:MAG: hypothetical protein ACO1Q7_03885 [Gemmatimonas sp.]
MTQPEQNTPREIPAEYRHDFEAMPMVLRELLQAELNAGNTIDEVGHSHPAVPAGAYFKLANPVTTRARASGDGISFYERNSSIYSGEFTDEKRFFFVLEPPLPPPPDVDMDAIRASIAPKPVPPRSTGSDNARGVSRIPIENTTVSSAFDRFTASRDINYERWKEGEGYDLEALREIPASSQAGIVSSLIPPRDWRDVEALIVIDSSPAHDALRAAAADGSIDIRLAVMERAPEYFTEQQRVDTLVAAIQTAVVFGGLTQALDMVEEFHPPAVQQAMFDALVRREGDVAYHLATSLAVIHGKISSRYDWTLRQKLLEFNTTDSHARVRALLDFCTLLDIDSKPELSAVRSSVERLRKYAQ